MNRALAAISLLGFIGLAACEKKAAPVVPPTIVTVTPVQQDNVAEMRTWVGLLDGYQNAEIRAQVTGYLMTQNYKEGSFVKKGTELFTIDKRPFEAALAQAKADYAKSVATAQLSQITLDRQTQLYKTKVISQQEYDTAYQTAAADIAAATASDAQVQTAQINLDYCTITAPFDGVTGVAQAQIGDLVGPGGTASVLTQMSQINPIKANFSITEQEYLVAAAIINEKEASGQKAPEVIVLRLADGSTYPNKGRYDFVNRQINVATGSIQVTALFPNDGLLLRPGLFARITAPVRELKDALLVPQASVVELQGNHLVSLVDASNVVSTIPVKLGPTQGPMQVVTGKLKAGDKVVVGGAEKVKPGMKVEVQPYQPPATPAPAQEKKPE
jgi:membrane fusion protein (multidrug efflux system)